jgi:HSP20 family protein
LPGVPLDATRVDISEDELTIAGERSRPRSEPGDRCEHTEGAYGRFRRQIPLPAGACPNRAAASFQDGVLEVRVPIVLDEATELGGGNAVSAYRGAA